MEAELSWRGRTGSVAIDGVCVTRLHRSALRERAQAAVAGSDWSLVSHRGAIMATGSDGSPRHLARGEGVLIRRWTLQLATSAWRMDPSGPRGWRLVDASTEAEVGTVQVRGIFSQRVEALLPAGTTPDAVVFVLWVADVRARRRTAVPVG